MPLLTTDSSGPPLLFGRTTFTLAGADGPLSADGVAEDWGLAGAVTGALEAGSGAVGLAEGAMAGVAVGAVGSDAAGLAGWAMTGVAAGVDGAGAAGLTVGTRAGPAKGVGPGRMLEKAVATAFPAALALVVWDRAAVMLAVVLALVLLRL